MMSASKTHDRSKLLVVLITMGVVLVGLGLNLLPVPARAQTECPAIPADGPGVQRLEGQGSYSFYGIPIIVDQPVIALTDATYEVQGLADQFAPSDGQVIGRLTSDFFTSPFSFTISLPMLPTGLALDIDNDGVDEPGVQIYKAVLGQNILNTPFLEQIASGGMLRSFTSDEETHEILSGDLILYAADDEQGFPCAEGEDGQLFTDDDPTVALPPGYTIARIADGEITFDRSPVGITHVVENPGTATPDFSEQGILESFETMIDFMKERYVFNTFNDVDWDALAEAVRPQVEQADAEGSLGRYAVALLDLAQAVGDAHVYVDPSLILTDPAERAVWNEFQAFGSAGVGATTVELDDGRIVVNQVTPDGPADAAGLTFGTEVVSVNGRLAPEVLAETPYPWPNFPGSPEARRFAQATYLLNAPPGDEVEVGYMLPDTTEVMTTTFTAAELERPQVHRGIMPVDYSLVDGYGYVTWPGFTRTGISSHIFSDFIKRMAQQQIPGIILDLRSNGGGSALLEYAMLSYLYSEDDPFTFAGEMNYRFNTETGEFISDFSEMTLSAPENATAYPGEVVVLVDQVCASACEFMSYYLQFTDRATIIGQYASTGAGGNTNQVILPGPITFNYTAGTNLLDETGRPTFQGVGVVPDVRVPVTEESEQAKLEGGDPVLDAAVTYLHEQELKALELKPAPFAEGQITMTIPPNWVPNESMTKYTSPDDESIIAVAPYTTTNDIEPDAIEQRIDEDAEKVGEYKTDLATWSIYHTPFGDQAATVFVATIDETPYVGVLIAKDDDFRDLLQRYILEPALDSFEIVEE